MLALDGVLAPDALARVRDAMRSAAGEDAGVLGREPGTRVASTARRASRLELPADLRRVVGELLAGLRPRLADHFGRELDAHEQPQFLRYVEGDYFVAHQDGNTPVVHDESRFRKVSIVIFVTDPADYRGGSLLIHPPIGEAGEPVTVAPAAGRLVAYPAETTHEVTPITAGERLTIVSWYRAGG